MTTYLEIAQTLADSGYLSYPDVEVAAEVLSDALDIDESELEEAVLEAQAAADTAIAEDDVPFEAIDQVHVHDDVMNVAGDAEVLAGGEAAASAAFVYAARALAEAGLIAVSNIESVSMVIAEVRAEDDDYDWADDEDSSDDGDNDDDGDDDNGWLLE